MMKKSLLVHVAVFLTVILSLTSFPARPAAAEPGDIYVSDNSSSIQAAIDGTSP
jgi:hypothetical protein